VSLSAQFQSDQLKRRSGAFSGRELDVNKPTDQHFLLEPYLLKKCKNRVFTQINEVQEGKGSR